MTATPAWLAAFEALLNRGIAGSAQAAELTDRLEATAIRIEVRGVITVHAGVSAGRLALIAVDGPAGDTAAPAAATPAATITGSPLALLQLARGGTAARGTAAQVRGDAEVANAYRRLFTLARPDPEEELSRVIGDFPARRLTQFAGRTLDWARQVRRTAGENVAEYLQEEGRDLVNRTELDEFLQGVDALRDTAERVAARLARLEQRFRDAP